MEGSVKPDYKDDFENEDVSSDRVLGDFETSRPKGLPTSAGRGYAQKPATIKKPGSAHDNTHSSTGRGGVISLLKTAAERTESKPPNDSSFEIHQQLRQATGAGYSNSLIEQHFGAKPKDVLAQYEDAEGGYDRSDIVEKTLVPAFSAQAKVGENVKSAGGKKKKVKDRAFQKYNPDSRTVEETSMTEVDRSRLPKKTIAEIFRDSPDYQKSYNSQKLDPFTLGSKNDFPALK